MSVPETLEQAISPDWLTEALGRRFPGVKVVDATLGEVVSRVSTNACFEIECAGGVPEGLPQHLCVKGYFSDTSARQAGEPEVLFYRDLAERFGVRTLNCVYADLDPVTRHGVIITEDVAAAGATFLDALTPYSTEQTAASLELYATMHSRTWGDPTLAHEAWLAPRIARTLQARGLREIRGNFEGPIGTGVPVEVRDAERLVRVLTGLAHSEQFRDTGCLLHGDAHIGNVFLDASGRPFILDWQLVQQGPWYMDVGYHIGCALTTEDRRNAEDDLLRHYLDLLGQKGGTMPSPDEIRTGVCVGLVYGFFLWAITLKVRPVITTAMLERLGTAVADHDALSVVERMTGTT